MDSICTSAFIHNIFTFPFNDFFFNSPPHGNLKSRLVQFSSDMAFIYCRTRLKVTAHPLPIGSLLVKSEQERAKERVNIVQTRILFRDLL